MTQEELIELHRAVLRQIAAMYDNPEMKRVIQSALRNDWNNAFYDKFKPEILKKKMN